MGKNQSASNLTNIIKQDASGNITFVSGSTTLMSVSSSGAIATTGNVAGTASYASNAELLDGAHLSILATTGSNTFTGIQTVNSNLIVTGSITAQTLVVQTITSSVDFVTGSTRFGSLLGNTHVFSGSVTMNPGGLFVSGSGDIGVGTVSPNLTAANRKVLDINGTTESILVFSSGNTYKSYIFNDGTNLITQGTTLKFQTSFTDRLTISSTGAATFSSTVTANGGLISSAITMGGNNDTISASSNSGFLTIGSTQPIRFTDTSTSEWMRISSTGNVGIGTSSPQAKFVISNAGAEGFEFIPADSSNYNRLQSYSRSGGVYNTLETRASVHIWAADATERMRLTNAGVLQLNTTGPGLVTLGASTSYGQINGGGGAALYLNGATRGGATTAGSSAAVLALDGNFYLSDSSTNTYKFSVNSSGNVIIGNTGASNGTLDINGSASNSRPLLYLNQGGYAFIAGQDTYHGIIIRGVPAAATDYSVTASDYMSFVEYGGRYNFYQKQPGGLTLQIKFDTGTIYASNTTVQSISDIRTKENIKNSEQGLDVITALRPVRFDFKDGFNESKKNQLGFIAQEVEEIFPDAVSEWEKEDGEIYKTVGPGALIPVLVKAIQELKAEIDELKNR